MVNDRSVLDEIRGTNSKVLFEVDCEEVSKVFVSEISHHTKLSARVLGCDATALDLISSAVGIHGIVSLGRTALECKPKHLRGEPLGDVCGGIVVAPHHLPCAELTQQGAVGVQ
jgi:hypothetical protein